MQSKRNEYHTRDPGAPIPEKSASDYLGIPYNAEFEQWYEKDHGRTGYTTPFLKYQGPKNSTNLGEPNSDGDRLAKIHDLRYAYASYKLSKGEWSENQFHEAITFADDDFVESNSYFSVPGIIGKTGITIKNWIEKANEKIGGSKHIYPGKPDEGEYLQTSDDVEVKTMADQKKEFVKNYLKDIDIFQGDEFERYWNWGGNTTNEQREQVREFYPQFAEALDEYDNSQNNDSVEPDSQSSEDYEDDDVEMSSTVESTNNTTPVKATKRTAEPGTNEATPLKQANIQGQVQSSNMATLPGTAAPQAGGSKGGEKFAWQAKPTHFGSKISVYKKTHLVSTFGVTGDGIKPAGSSYVFMPTCLAEIPWDKPVFYMTPNEFALLPNGARCKSVKIKAYYRKTAVQFNTNASTTQQAVLNTVTDCVSAEGLNRTGYGYNVNYTTFTTDNPMVVTALRRPIYSVLTTSAPVYRGMIADYYGANTEDANFLTYQPKNQLGMWCLLRNYFAMVTKQKVANEITGTTGGWPNLNEKLHSADGDTIGNTLILDMHYEPKMGPLKTPLKHRQIGDPILSNLGTTNYKIPTVGSKGNFFLPQFTRTNTIVGGASSMQGSVQDVTNAPTNNNADITFDIYTPIEKSQFMRSGIWGDANAHVQPSAHIGVKPVPALSTDALNAPDNATTYTTTRGFFMIEAEMVVEEILPTNYPFGDESANGYADIPFGDQIIWAENANLPAGCQQSGVPHNSASSLKGGLMTTQGNSLPAIT